MDNLARWSGRFHVVDKVTEESIESWGSEVLAEHAVRTLNRHCAAHGHPALQDRYEVRMDWRGKRCRP